MKEEDSQAPATDLQARIAALEARLAVISDCTSWRDERLKKVKDNVVRQTKEAEIMAGRINLLQKRTAFLEQRFVKLMDQLDGLYCPPQDKEEDDIATALRLSAIEAQAMEVAGASEAWEQETATPGSI